jgi:hypothetical protein
MALIAPIVIGCIDYLAYGTIFTRAMFRPKNNLTFFFAKKAVYACGEVVRGLRTTSRQNRFYSFLSKFAPQIA